MDDGRGDRRVFARPTASGLQTSALGDYLCSAIAEKKTGRVGRKRTSWETKFSTHEYSEISVSKSTTSTPTSSRFSSTIDALSWSVASSKPRKNVESVLGGMVSVVGAPRAQRTVRYPQKEKGRESVGRRGRVVVVGERARRKDFSVSAKASPSKFTLRLPRASKGMRHPVLWRYVQIWTYRPTRFRVPGLRACRAVLILLLPCTAVLGRRRVEALASPNSPSLRN